MISLALLAAISIDAASIAQTSATLNALGPHPFGSPRNQAAAQFVAAKFKEAGLLQTAAEDFVFEGAPGVNVISSVQGRSDRLLIIATHHDSKKDARDVSDRSRSLSLLVEIGRYASRLRPMKTWILASFDGGESTGEGFAHYLESLGKSRSLIDGVVLLDASPLRASPGTPSVIAPACATGAAFERRGIASHDLVAAAVRGIPASLDFSFDDPGISLLTQPFIRAFRTSCDPTAARATAYGLGVLLMADTSFSKTFLGRDAVVKPTDPALRDQGAVRLGEVAVAAVHGIDDSAPPSEASPRSDSWLVVGRSVWPGWLLFLLGLLSLIPGLLALRADRTKLALRVLYSVLFTWVLYSEPEVALFAGILPNLWPPPSSKKFLTLSLVPFGLLLSAGLLGLVRGQVTGSWLSVFVWAGLLAAFALLYAAPGPARKSPPKTKRGKSGGTRGR